MKIVALMVVLVMMAVASASATPVLFEDWESGTDGWLDVGTIIPGLSTAQNTTPGGANSLLTVDTATNYTNAKDYKFGFETSKNWAATWSFMDVGSTREFIQLRSYSPTNSLQQLISFGVYNAAPCVTSKYNYRITNGAAGWQNTTISRAANVWHTMKVEQIWTGSGPATLNFWVDGALGFSGTTTAVFGLTEVRVGSALGNVKGAYYDDILVEDIVPEPGSMLALGTGLIGLLGIVRRRK